MFEKIPDYLITIIIAVIGLIGTIIGYFISFYTQKKTIDYQMSKERQINILESIYEDLIKLNNNLDKGNLETSLDNINKFINSAKFIALNEYKNDFLKLLELNNSIKKEKDKIRNLIASNIHKFLSNKGTYEKEEGYTGVSYDIPDAFIVIFILNNPQKFQLDIIRYIEQSQQKGIDYVFGSKNDESFESDRPYPRITKKDLIKFYELFYDDNIGSKTNDIKKQYFKIKTLTNNLLKILEKKIK